MSVEQRKAEPGLRASDRDRDEALVGLHTAYAEGRLTETELDERIDLVLAARTHAELDQVSADLPSTPSGPAPAHPAHPASRFQLAYKSAVKRSGQWRLPAAFTAVIYKGHSLLDLRAAELEGPVTTIRVLAYKSTVEILTPPGARIEAAGMGVSAEVHDLPTADARVIRVQGFAYKGEIEVKDRFRRS